MSESKLFYYGMGAVSSRAIHQRDVWKGVQRKAYTMNTAAAAKTAAAAWDACRHVAQHGVAFHDADDETLAAEHYDLVERWCDTLADEVNALETYHQASPEDQTTRKAYASAHEAGALAGEILGWVEARIPAQPQEK